MGAAPLPAARTLVATADAVWLWPGIPMTIEDCGAILPISGPWVRSWIARLHGFEAQHAPIESALEWAARWLNAGDVPAAQFVLDQAGLAKLSLEGAVLVDAIAARLGISAPEFPVGTKSLPGGVGNLSVEAKLFDFFAGAAAELEKVYNKDQPRWPKGAPNSQGGKFSPKGSDEGSDADAKPGTSESGPGMGHNDGPPLDDPPDIPEEKPPTSELRNAVIKSVARWLLRRGVLFLIPGEGEALAGLQIAEWLYDYFPYINAYLDKPKTLEELNDAANDPKVGYDIHHIVEQTPGRDAGFPESQIESPANRVRISTLKHWEINGWYSRINPDYGNVSPRDYLRDKGWEERYQVGLQALRDVGVLKP